MTTVNFRLRIAYNGAHYFGWQKTASGPSIEGSLERALQQFLGEKPFLQAASRTDRGVHATGQVVNLVTQKKVSHSALLLRLNALLPRSIRVLEAEEVALTFHPTLEALGKEYWYDISLGPVQSPFLRTTAWHYPNKICLKELQLAAEQLIGKHDFSGFSGEKSRPCKNPICHLSRIDIIPLSENRLRFILVGDRFLYKMVRIIVGTLMQIGSRKLNREVLSTILTSELRKNAGVTAPAHGLTLHQVFYDFAQ